MKENSKLVIGSDGYPVFPDTRADLKYVPAISEEKARDALYNLITSNPTISNKVISHYLGEMEPIPKKKNFNGMQKLPKKEKRTVSEDVL